MEKDEVWETQTHDAIWTVRIHGRQNGRTREADYSCSLNILYRYIYTHNC
jgi:hypothetical protein